MQKFAIVKLFIQPTSGIRKNLKAHNLSQTKNRNSALNFTGGQKRQNLGVCKK